MKSGNFKLILVVSLLLNISFLASAGYQYYRQSAYWTSPLGMKIKKGHFLFEELSLRPDQLKVMREAATKFRGGISEKRQAIAGKRAEMLRLMRADNPDLGAIKSIISEISGMQEEMQKMIAMHMLDIKTQLDKEQQRKFLDLIETAMMEGRQVECPPVVN